MSTTIKRKFETNHSLLLELFLKKLSEAIKDPSRKKEVLYLKNKINSLEMKCSQEDYRMKPLNEPDETFCIRCMAKNVRTKLLTFKPTGQHNNASFYWFCCNICNAKYPNFKKNAALFPIKEPKLTTNEIQETLSPEIPNRFICYCGRFCKCYTPSSLNVIVPKDQKVYRCSYNQCDFHFAITTGTSAELRRIAIIKRQFKIDRNEPPMKKRRVV